MTQSVTESLNFQFPIEPVTGEVTLAHPPLEETNPIADQISRPKPTPSTNPIEVTDYPVDDLLVPIPDTPTGLFQTGSAERAILPPAAQDVFSKHDLQAEARAIGEKDTGEGELVLPPLVSTEDALTARDALQNHRNIETLIRRFGQADYAQVVKKIVAIGDVSIANAHQSAKTAFQQYNMVRRSPVPLEFPAGDAKPDDTVLFIDPALMTEGQREPFADPVFHEIPEGSLALNAQESTVVLEALRLAVLRPDRKTRNLSAIDLLARYDPSEGKRAIYRAVLKRVGVRLEQAQSRVPEYPLAHAA